MWQQSIIIISLLLNFLSFSFLGLKKNYCVIPVSRPTHWFWCLPKSLYGLFKEGNLKIFILIKISLKSDSIWRSYSQLVKHSFSDGLYRCKKYNWFWFIETTNISFNIQNIVPPKTYNALKNNLKISLPTEPTLFSLETGNTFYFFRPYAKTLFNGWSLQYHDNM